MRTRVIILGAEGKAFHIFNTCYRERPEFEVLFFVKTPFSQIKSNLYPPQLSGGMYGAGLPILAETASLHRLIQEYKIAEVVFASTEVPYDYLSRLEQEVFSAGAEFQLAHVERAMLTSPRPLIAVCGVRSGCGKSWMVRLLSQLLHKQEKKIALWQYPQLGEDPFCPYRRLLQSVDIGGDCLAEIPFYMGIDAAELLTHIQPEEEILVWDGGHNDLPFAKPHLYITMADSQTLGRELAYYPSDVNVELAHLIVLNAPPSVPDDVVAGVLERIRHTNDHATVLPVHIPLDNQTLLPVSETFIQALNAFLERKILRAKTRY